MRGYAPLPGRSIRKNCKIPMSLSPYKVIMAAHVKVKSLSSCDSKWLQCAETPVMGLGYVA